MEAHTKRPGGVSAGPSDLFLAEHSDDTATTNSLQGIQRYRLQQEFGLSVHLAALIAGLVYGEGEI